MKQLIKQVPIAILALLFLLSCEHKPDLNNYNWMLGNWEFPNEDTLTFEVWNEVSDTLYEGFNFKVHNTDTIYNEHLWLESRGGKVVLSAKVYGHNEDRRIFFELGLKNKQVARFENHHHDFPTIIEYRHTHKNHMEVHVKNETKALAPIVMQRIDSEGKFVE